MYPSIYCAALSIVNTLPVNICIYYIILDYRLFWKRLFAGTVPANKNLFDGTILASKNLYAGTPSVGPLNIFPHLTGFFSQKK